MQEDLLFFSSISKQGSQVEIFKTNYCRDVCYAHAIHFTYQISLTFCFCFDFK